MKPMKWIPVRKAGTFVGKYSILPILTLKLGDRYLAEKIYNEYLEKEQEKIRLWYENISPVQVILNSVDFDKSTMYDDIIYSPVGFLLCRKYFDDYLDKRVDLLDSIKMIGHPEFIKKTDKQLMSKGCQEFNISGDIHNDFKNITGKKGLSVKNNISAAEYLLNLQTDDISKIEKARVFNHIMEIYQQFQRDHSEYERYRLEEEVGDIPYDVLNIKNTPIYKVCDVFSDFKSMSLLWTCGYIMDSKNNVFCL